MTEPRPPGRPTLLTDGAADELVAAIARGETFRQAAASVGVTERTIRGWRSRAWSRRPEDLAFVALERRLIAALAASARPNPALDFDWRAAAAALEAQFPTRWALPEAPDEPDGPLDE